ncbi:MAG: hypothetical protein AABY10_02670 [Nanoarchaeota archaeon]
MKKRSGGKVRGSVRKYKVRTSAHRVSGSRRSLFKSSNVPGFVKVIALLYYISAVLTILTGMILSYESFGGSHLRSSLGVDSILSYTTGGNPIDEWFLPLFFSSLILGSLFLIIVGIVEVIVGNSLLKAKNWARILTIVLMCVSLVGALASVDLISVVVSVLIGSYLWFNRAVRRAFK